MNTYMQSQREVRKNSIQKANKLLKDIRIFFDGESSNTLFFPYNIIYANLFRTLFQNKGLKCPTYNHIYINISETLKKALESAPSNYQIPWFEVGIATLNIDEYLKVNEKEKQEMIFQSICEGMYDIFSIDKLDQKILEETISQIREKGPFQELVHKKIKNKELNFIITYRMNINNEKLYYDVYFHLFKGDEMKSIYFGRLDNIDKVYCWFKKIEFIEDNIVIWPSDSTSSVLTLKGNYCCLIIPFSYFSKIDSSKPLINSKYFKKIKFPVYIDTNELKNKNKLHKLWRKYLDFLSK